jgi:hypothetical protein
MLVYLNREDKLFQSFWMLEEDCSVTFIRIGVAGRYCVQLAICRVSAESTISTFTMCAWLQNPRLLEHIMLSQADVSFLCFEVVDEVGHGRAF